MHKTIILLICKVVIMNALPNICDNRNLKDEYIQFSKQRSPAGSESWNKTQRLLTQARLSRAYLVNSMLIYRGVMDRVDLMLQCLDITTVRLKTFTSKFYEQYQAGRDVVFEVSYLALAGHPIGLNTTLFMEQGSHSVHLRVLLQSEQLNGKWAKQIMRILKPCHFSPTCIVWEYSDYNFYLAEELWKGITQSFLLVPSMLQPVGASSESPPRPLRSRQLEVVAFLGGMTAPPNDRWFGRRVHFRSQLVQAARRHGWNIGVNRTSDVTILEEMYSDAMTCPCVHASADNSPGEFHRLSEVMRYGCVPIFETFMDTVGVNLFRECGGVIFSPFDAMIPNIARVAEGIRGRQRKEIWKDRLEAMTWWKMQDIVLNEVLKDLFGSFI